MKNNIGRIVKAMAFEKAVSDVIRENNPSIKFQVLKDNYSTRRYDAIADKSLNLTAFGKNIIYANRIVVQFISSIQTIDSIKLFIERENNSFNAFVFIVDKYISEKDESKIYHLDHQIVLITKKELIKNPKVKRFYYDLHKNLTQDNEDLLRDNLPDLISTKNNLAFALGAGCSHDSNISDWITLSRALGYELLYTTVDSKESEYKNKIITDSLNDSVFSDFDNTSALDAIFHCFDALPTTSINQYWMKIKNVLYMSYDSPADAQTPLMNSISNCIKRRGINSVINYNFDSVLEQNMKPRYRSKPDEILRSTTNINGCDIFHVHGFIPYDYDGKTDVHNYIFTDKEYYDNMKNPYSFTNTTQASIINKYNVIFVGVSFTDSNMKEILRERVRNGFSNKIFGIKKLPKFDFKGTNNDLMEREYKILFQHYFDSLGVNIVWIKDFKEIPGIIDKI